MEILLFISDNQNTISSQGMTFESIQTSNLLPERSTEIRRRANPYIFSDFEYTIHVAVKEKEWKNTGEGEVRFRQ
jgi:hypothetical protein